MHCRYNAWDLAAGVRINVSACHQVVGLLADQISDPSSLQTLATALGDYLHGKKGTLTTVDQKVSILQGFDRLALCKAAGDAAMKVTSRL